MGGAGGGIRGTGRSSSAAVSLFLASSSFLLCSRSFSSHRCSAPNSAPISLTTVASLPRSGFLSRLKSSTTRDASNRTRNSGRTPAQRSACNFRCASPSWPSKYVRLSISHVPFSLLGSSTAHVSTSRSWLHRLTLVCCRKVSPLRWVSHLRVLVQRRQRWNVLGAPLSMCSRRKPLCS